MPASAHFLIANGDRYATGEITTTRVQFDMMPHRSNKNSYAYSAQAGRERSQEINAPQKRAASQRLSANSNLQSLVLHSIGGRAKLVVSQPGDALGQEAARVANRAMRIPGPMAKLDRSPLILEKVRGGMKAASAYVHRKESSAGRDKRARP